jgi:hypothetical protein
MASGLALLALAVALSLMTAAAATGEPHVLPDRARTHLIVPL